MSSSPSSQRGASRRTTGTTSGSGRRKPAPTTGARVRTAPQKRASKASGRPAPRKAVSTRGAARRSAGPWVPVFAVVTLVLVGWALYPALRLQYQTSRRVAGLEQQYDSLRKRNEGLRAAVAEIKTPEGIEKAAREKLGFVKQGEHVYVVTGSQTTSKTASSVAAEPREPSALQVILDAVFGVEQAPTPDRAP